MEFIDKLWENGPRLIQNEKVFKLGTDSVLLAHYVIAKEKDKVCDIGTGSSVISIILATKNKCDCVGIDIQKESTELADKNVKINNLESKISIINGDIRKYKDIFNAGEYDIIVTNPPYFKAGSGYSSTKETLANSREEKMCTLEDIVCAASYLCKWGGSFYIVHKPEMLAEICYLMKKYKIEPKRLRFVQYKNNISPNLILIEGKRGGKPSLMVEKPLILTNDDGSDTEEIKKIYHRKG